MNFNAASAADVAILLPTMNRPGFLARALEYYVRSKFPGQVYIVDSSTNEHQARVEKIVEHYKKSNLDVRHDHIPSSHSISHCFRHVGLNTAKPYIAMAGDDDVQTVSGLAACAGFLNASPQYGASRAHRVEVQLGDRVVRGPLLGVAVTPYPDYNIAKPQDRLFAYAKTATSLQYAVMRREIFNAAYDKISDPPLDYFSEEFWPCAMIALQTPIPLIPTIGAIMQVDNSGVMGVTRASMFDVTLEPTWPVRCREMLDDLTETMIRCGGADRESAARLVKQAVWFHVNFLSSHQYHCTYLSTFPDRKRDMSLFDTLNQSADFRLALETYADDCMPAHLR